METLKEAESGDTPSCDDIMDSSYNIDSSTGTNS